MARKRDSCFDYVIGNHTAIPKCVTCKVSLETLTLNPLASPNFLSWHCHCLNLCQLQSYLNVYRVSPDIADQDAAVSEEEKHPLITCQI